MHGTAEPAGHQLQLAIYMHLLSQQQTIDSVLTWFSIEAGCEFVVPLRQLISALILEQAWVGHKARQQLLQRQPQRSRGFL